MEIVVVRTLIGLPQGGWWGGGGDMRNSLVLARPGRVKKKLPQRHSRKKILNTVKVRPNFSKTFFLLLSGTLNKKVILSVLEIIRSWH